MSNPSMSQPPLNRLAGQHAHFWKTHAAHSRSITEFEKAFAKKPNGTSKRTDQGETGRFRSFNRDVLKKRGENLDINWLKDENASNHNELPEPDAIAAMIRERLATAMEEMDALTALLETSETE